MSVDKLTILGTASHLPTRNRAHNGYVVDIGGVRLLFDPGEGTQRQLTITGVSVTSIDGVCLTHFHGDHCLGLPGVIQRRSVDNHQNNVDHELPVVFPKEGFDYFNRLRYATIYTDSAHVVPVPTTDGDATNIGSCSVVAKLLNHSCTTLGYRVTAPDSFNFDVERLEHAGIAGQDRAELKATGKLSTPNGEVQLEDFGSVRPGKVVAFIMDTAPCDNAVELARDADLVICESTYAETESELASQYLHMTAKQAAEVAQTADAKKLVLTHYSARYDDEQALATEAKEVFSNSIAAKDLDVITF